MSDSTDKPGRGASKLTDVLYGGALLLGLPWIIAKRIRKPDSFFELNQKFGHTPPRPDAPRILIHAVSVGEALGIKPLVERLKAINPANGEIVVSTTTKTGKEVAETAYGADRVVRFPLDFSWMVKRFLDRVQPDVVLLMELEIWPNFVAECRARAIPVIVVNGRLTERAFNRYKKVNCLVRRAFADVILTLAQDDLVASRFKSLGAPDAAVQVAGSLKLDNLDFNDDAESARTMRETLGIAPSSPVIVAGSIHPGEDRIVIDCYRRLLETHPSLCLVVVPRHPPRVPEMAETFKAAGFDSFLYSQRTDGQPAAPRSVRIIDVVGILKTTYRIANIAVIGGSFIPHGGQNFLEPLAFGIPVASGLSLFNFQGAADLLAADGLPARCEDSDALVRVLSQWLSDPESARLLGQRGKERLRSAQGALEKTMTALKPFLDKHEWTGQKSEASVENPS